MLACMLFAGGTGVRGILMILVLLLLVCPRHVWVSALCLTVQRAEFWGVVLAMQATNAVHLGVDNLNVVWHVGRLLDGVSTVCPFELVDDGDLIILIRKLLSIRGEGTVCISKVKGHADEGLVRSGQVRAVDRFGYSRADEAADFGRRRVWPDVADVGGIFLVSVGCGILLFCSCIVSSLPFLVLSSIVMTLLVWPLILFWSAGAFLRGAVLWDVALLPGPLRLWDSWSSWSLFWVLFIGPLLVVI